MIKGRASSQRRTGSTQMIDTASRARLVFANATMLPNWIISGSFSYCGAPPDKVITVAIVSALTTAAASVGEEGRDPVADMGRAAHLGDRVQDRQLDDRDEHEVREVEPELDQRRPAEEERCGRSDEHGDQVVGRRQEEEPDDRRELAQGERVRLPAEMDLDDLQLGGGERDGEHRPGKRERDRRGRADVQLREVDPDGGERQGTGEQPDPCSHRQRLVAAEGSDEASGCGRVEVESRHIRDEDADPFPPATERQTTGPTWPA